MSNSARIRQALERYIALFTKRPAAAQVSFTTTARSLDGHLCQVEDGAWRFQVDQPVGYGGGGKAPDPGVYGRGTLAACLVQSYLMWFARLDVPVDGVEVEVTGRGDLRGSLGLDDGLPPGYGELSCVVRVTSQAPAAEIERAIETAERHSPWHYNLVAPVPIARRIEIAGAAEP